MVVPVINGFFDRNSSFFKVDHFSFPRSRYQEIFYWPCPFFWMIISSQCLTIMTAAKRTANPRSMVNRPISGESRISNRSRFDNSIVVLFFNNRTFGPMTWSWRREALIKLITRNSLKRMGGGQLSGDEKSVTHRGRRRAPVAARRASAHHTSVRNRRARLTNQRWAVTGSGACLRSGTATNERNNIPPTQKAATVKCTQMRMRLKRFTTRIVA